IRGYLVTGVQTCALPIYVAHHPDNLAPGTGHRAGLHVLPDRITVREEAFDKGLIHDCNQRRTLVVTLVEQSPAKQGHLKGAKVRSEERRGGKEWRWRW